MAVKAVLMDFYGTIVHEDGPCVSKICDLIASTASESVEASDVAAFWWDIYQTLFKNSAGKRFINKKQIALRSLQKTVQYFGSSQDASLLVKPLYEQWKTPPIFDDSKAFLKKCPVPVCFVSNSDHDDLQQAIIYHELLPETFITSEDARCYKPDSVIFQHTLNCLSLTKNDVIFIGDSITCDVIGALQTGIDVIWLNRDNKPISQYLNPSRVCSSLIDVLRMGIFE